MIDKESTYYFYEQVNLILTSEIGNKTLSKINQIFKEAIDLILKNYDIQFSSYYSKLNYIIKSFSIPEELSLDFLKLLAYLKKFNNQIISKQNLQRSINILLTFIKYFSNSPIPYFYNFDDTTVDLSVTEEKYIKPKERVDIYDAVIIQKKHPNRIICKTENKEIEILIDLAFWEITYNSIWEYCSINLINIIAPEKNSTIYRADKNSAIIIEPNYLIDVTDLSACFTQNQPIAILYFIKKFNQVIPNEEILIGNFVNNLFDELLTNKNTDFESIIDKTIRQKYLQVFLLVLQKKFILKDIKQKLQIHYNNLKNIILKLNYDSISIEPTFISPKYGLQGRLDALLKFKDAPNLQNIIELKSGKFPINKISTSFDNKQEFFLNIWFNHLIQANCYDLLLNSTFENRTGTTSILYSKDVDKPLRDASLTPFSVISIINTRNQIIFLDKLLRSRKFDLFYRLLIKAKESSKNFTRELFDNIIQKFKSSDKLTNKYFFEYFALIQKEIYKSKIGDSSNKGFSSLWLDSYYEKLENFSVVTNLTLDHSKSDFENFHLIFSSHNDLSNFNSLRTGDQVIIYPMKDEETEVCKNQLLKAIIKDINNKTITISLRNKNPDFLFLVENKNWVIELDQSDSLLSKVISSIYQSYNLSDSKKNLIFGKLKPEFNEINHKKYPNLNDTQNLAVNRALAAKNYFLIQGPPGTGKTSFVIKTIISEIYYNSNDKILVLAYTNRAVDEIISAAKSIAEDIKLIRFGSKETSQHQDVLLSYLAENMELNQLYLKLKQTRIYATTIASVLYNPEILNITKFNIAIIDEASQILEPYLINIISQVDKFILIGDEKQLPAIISLNDEDTEVKIDELKSIGLTNFKLSFFERLLNLCISNAWDDAYILLNLQARMNVEIQDFPNNYFYYSKLKTMNNNQNNTYSKYYKHIRSKFLSDILKHRIIFINTKQENYSKINLSEVNFIKKFINDFFEEFHNIENNTIGIISPFRAQCAEILKQLNDKQKQLITCDTVERFQGSERDIIIISMATNFEYLINSIQSPNKINDKIIDRKLNVAITRAKEHLIILGNSKILETAPSYKELISYLKQKEKFFELKEFFK